MSMNATVARAGRAGLACIAGFGLAILSASLAQALYGPRTTIGAYYQQSSTTESPDGINQGQCTGGSCYVMFQRVPQGKSLIVQHMSCWLSLDSDNVLRTVRLSSRKGSNFQFRYARAVPVKTSTVYWIVNSPVLHLIKSGERPIILFGGTVANPWQISCSISGQLKQP